MPLPETFAVPNVEILETGFYNGHDFTKRDLADIVQAHTEIGDRLKPFLKLGHDEKQVLLQEGKGYPAAAWITNVRANESGDRVLADFMAVPAQVKDLMDRKAYGRFSSEVLVNGTFGGKRYPKSLRAVAMLGGETPAMTGLKDFIDLYSAENADDVKVVYATIGDEKNVVRLWGQAEEVIPLVGDEDAILATFQRRSEVQTVIFSKTRFKTAESAKSWARGHDFRADKVDETSVSFRLRQVEPGTCDRIRTDDKDIVPGVKLVFCIKSVKLSQEGDVEKNEEKVIKLTTDLEAEKKAKDEAVEEGKKKDVKIVKLEMKAELGTRAGQLEKILGPAVAAGKVTPALRLALEAAAYSDLLPADKEGVRTFSYKDGEGGEKKLTFSNAMEMVNLVIDSLPQLAEFSKPAPPKDMPAPDTSGEAEDDELIELTQKYMDEHDGVSHTEAAKIVTAQHLAKKGDK